MNNSFDHSTYILHTHTHSFVHVRRAAYCSVTKTKTPTEWSLNSSRPSRRRPINIINKIVKSHLRRGQVQLSQRSLCFYERPTLVSVFTNHIKKSEKQNERSVLVPWAARGRGTRSSGSGPAEPFPGTCPQHWAPQLCV